MSSFTEVREWARQDVQRQESRYMAEERHRRQVQARADYEQRVRAAAPSWNRWYAERDSADLVRQIAASEKGPSKEQIANYERLFTASQEVQK